MFSVGQFRFVSSHLMWTSLLLLHLISAISMLNDTDTNVVQDLKDGKRNFLVMGVVKSRLVVIVGNVVKSRLVRQSRFKRQYVFHAPEDDYYVFDMSANSFTGDKFYLHNGTLFEDKWPTLYEWCKQKRDPVLEHYFIISDDQHGYLVAIDKNGQAYSYLIDVTPGDKVVTNKRSVNSVQTWLSSVEPLTAYFRDIKAGGYFRDTTRPPSLEQLGDHISDSDNFHISKTIFKGSNSLPEANWSEDDGGVYLCKTTDGQIMTQTDKCTTPLDWDMQGGFVDGDRVVVFDLSSNMHVFPKSAMERSNANKTVKVDNIAKADFVNVGEPPAHSWVIGLVVGFMIFVIAIVAFVVFYFCWVKSPSPANVKGTPKGSSNKTRMTSKGTGKQSTRHAGGSSKGQSSARHTGKRANSFKTSNSTPKGASSRKLKQKHARQNTKIANGANEIAPDSNIRPRRPATKVSARSVVPSRTRNRYSCRDL